MAINPINSDHISPAENLSNSSHAVKKHPVSQSFPSLPSFQSDNGDPVNLSSEREEFEAIKESIKQVPDIRQEKIEKIQKTLESGHYRVSSEDIADRIIQETVHNKAHKPR